MHILRRNEPLSSKKTMIISYKSSGRAKSEGWAGLFWQYPAMNWGNNKKGGFDFSTARNFYFYARGKNGGEIINFKIGGASGRYGDSNSISSGSIELTKYWKLYKMDVSAYEMHNIVSGFGVFFSRKLNGDGVTIYLNDLYFTDRMVPVKNKFWEFVHNKFNRILLKLNN
ncbi:MAG: hypothetical protein KAS64_02375 [Spirochaetes bacterium]|nr:hypothetical protein [Spirochaetota bacterium]